MTVFLFANYASTTIAGPISAGATTVNLAAGAGALFPAPGVGQQFALTLISQSDASQREITYCTGRSGDVCTVVRAQEGTTALAFIANDIAANYLTAATTASFIQASQLQEQPGNYAVDTGSVNNIQVALNPPPSSLALIAGAPVRILVANANTGNTTLTIAGLPTTSVFAQGGATGSLAAGSVLVGQIYEFVYVPGVGFEVSTAKVLLSLANIWALGQTVANGVAWSGLNTSAAVKALLGVDTSNNTVMYAGPTGASAWRVLNDAKNVALLYLGAAGNLYSVGQTQAQIGAVGAGNPNAAALLLDFPSVLNTVGWKQIPDASSPTGYYLLQWGLSGSQQLLQPVTFPVAFPNTCLNVTGMTEANALPSNWGVGAPDLMAIQAGSLSRTGFSYYSLHWTGSAWIGGSPGSASSPFWVAIGY